MRQLLIAVALVATPAATHAFAEPIDSVLNGRAVAWTSSNHAVASVSASGLVSGLSTGSATITATSEVHSGTASIAVLPARQVGPLFPWKEIAVICGVVRCDKVALRVVDDIRWRNRRPIGFRSTSIALGVLLLVALGFVGAASVSRRGTLWAAA